MTDLAAATRPADLDAHAILRQALDACRTRAHFSPFQESPSTRFHGEEAPKRGKAWFEGQLGRTFELDQPGTVGRLGAEVSPYTQEPLGVDYPKSDPEALFAAAAYAQAAWSKVEVERRADILVQLLFRLQAQSFENALATMHTAGQSYLMAYSGSGANALDRGLEALAYAYKAMQDVPAAARWERRFGAGEPARLAKRFRLAPIGTAVVVCCATFPLWNAYPAIFANLMTGNPVIVKPHPTGVLPVALAVRALREGLADAGCDPNLVLLAADTPSDQATIPLLKDSRCRIIDFTGSQRFGSWIERECADRLVFTETAGCNSVVLESVDNLDAAITVLSRALATFSAQMCTSPQNLYVPRSGVATPQGVVSYVDVRDRLVAAVEAISMDAKAGPATCATIQASATLGVVEAARREAIEAGARILRESGPVAHAEFPNARTASPLMIEAGAEQEALYDEERFGPVSYIVPVSGREEAVARATDLARRRGAIASYLYSTDESFIAAAEDLYVEAGASLSINMTPAMPINFMAAYSDYHVTGLNPAGNACLTDLAFVASRFRVVQFRRPT